MHPVPLLLSAHRTQDPGRGNGLAFDAQLCDETDDVGLRQFVADGGIPIEGFEIVRRGRGPLSALDGCITKVGTRRGLIRLD